MSEKLNEWAVFNEKNKELCEWLTQMESKVSQNGDISIEEMMEKLRKVSTQFLTGRKVPSHLALCVGSLFVVFLPGLPGGDQCRSGKQAAAAGDGGASGEGQPREQSCRDPAKTQQSQRALATPSGPHCGQVSMQKCSQQVTM